MNRQFGVLIVIGLLVALLGRLADQNGVWAAPGQSPERQSYPSMTPTGKPGVPTSTRVSAYTETPSPATHTPRPTTATQTPEEHSFTPSPSATAAPSADNSPTAWASDTTELVSSSTPLPAPTAPPTETNTLTPAPLGSTEPPLTTSEPPQAGSEVTDSVTAPPATLPAETRGDVDNDVLSALEADWMLLCGLGLLVLALILFTLRRIQGRRRRQA